MTIDKTATIHPSSVIEEGAIIGPNVKIGPFCFIASQVEIGEGSILKSHVVINGITKVGKNNKFFQFTSIGEVNQDLKYSGEPTTTEIGDNNTFHEGVTVHRGTVQANGKTIIGNNNLFMVNAHIAHDCLVGNNCVFANSATLAGHVTVGNYTIIGGLSAIHQFCRIGDNVMMGGGSFVVKDIPPYIIVQGNHAVPFGINIIGLKRHNFSDENIQIIKDCYKLLYRHGLTLEEAKEKIQALSVKYDVAKNFLDSLLNCSSRGIVR